MTANPTDAEALPNVEAHRPGILLRSALIGVASVLPLPGVGELLTTALGRGLVHHVVQLSFVDIEDDAVEVLLAPVIKEQRLGLLTALGGLGSILRRQRQARRMFVGLAVISGATEAVSAFHLATLLHHYCSHLHNGTTIQVADARRLRQVFDESTRTVQRQLGRSALAAVAKQSLELSQSLGRWGLAVLRRQESLPMQPLLIDVARGIRSWAADLSVRHYLGQLTDTFDKKWRAGGQTP